MCSFAQLRRVLLGSVTGLLFAGGAGASTIEPMSVPMRMAKADAIATCRVGSLDFGHAPSGIIQTRVALEILDVIKGRFPDQLELVVPGGKLGWLVESDGFSPRFEPGTDVLVFFRLDPAGRLLVMDGHFGLEIVVDHERGSRREVRGRAVLARARAVARGRRFPGRDLRPFRAGRLVAESGSPEAVFLGASVAADGGSGFLEDSSGIPRRFIAPDGGLPIGVLVDMEALPAGIMPEEALQAVRKALDAWEQATSIRFVIEGVTNFGQAADTIQTRDRKIRIQLHDLYEKLISSSVLAVGGGAFVTGAGGVDPLPGVGGRVFDREFNEAIRGFVILDHRKTTLQDLANFEQVICHEIGHAIGLDHSSNDPVEPEPYFKEAIMFFALSGAPDRGATLADYDIDTLGRSHPPGDTPPYSPPRVFEAVTAASAGRATLHQIPLINEVVIEAVDLHDAPANLSIELLPQTPGTFALNGNVLRYLPDDFAEGPRLSDSQIESGAVYPGRNAFVRVFNQNHASPIVVVRPVAIWVSQHPSQANPNGLPGNWAEPFFGTPTVDPHDDPDGDGFSTLEEFLAGSNPVDSNSRLRVTGYANGTLEWQARPFDVYRVETSTDLSNWNPGSGFLVPLAANPSAPAPPNGDSQFFRVRRVR